MQVLLLNHHHEGKVHHFEGILNFDDIFEAEVAVIYAVVFELYDGFGKVFYKPEDLFASELKHLLIAERIFCLH